MDLFLNKKLVLYLLSIICLVSTANSADVNTKLFVSTLVAPNNQKVVFPSALKITRDAPAKTMHSCPLLLLSDSDQFTNTLYLDQSHNSAKGVDELVSLNPREYRGGFMMPIHDYSTTLLEFDNGFPSVLKAISNKNPDQDLDELDLSRNSNNDSFENSKTLNPAASSIQIPFRIETRTEMTDKIGKSKTIVIETFISDGTAIEYHSRKEQWESEDTLKVSKDMLDKSKDASLRRLRKKLTSPVPGNAHKISEDTVLNLNTDMLEVNAEESPHQIIWVAEHPMLGRFIIKKIEETPTVIQVMQFSQIQFGEDVASDLHHSPVSLN